MEEEKKTAALEDRELEKAAGGYKAMGEQGSGQTGDRWVCDNCPGVLSKQPDDKCPTCGRWLRKIDSSAATRVIRIK